MYSFKVCIDKKVHFFAKSIFLEYGQPGFISTGMLNPEEGCNNLVSGSSMEEVGTLFTSLLKNCSTENNKPIWAKGSKHLSLAEQLRNSLGKRETWAYI